jgi:FkbM family methyltransferase
MGCGETKAMTIKKYYPFKDGPPIHYRAGTTDECIINAILGPQPEYLIPNSEDIKTIFDCGAHIGVTSILMANILKNATVFAFEPDYENYQLLVKNTEEYKNIQIFNCALAEDNGTGTLFPSDDPTNFGGKSLKIPVDGEAQLVQLRSISEVCRNLGTPDMIKVDTEGAEHEILNGIINLMDVKYIFGELHGVLDFCTLDLLDQAGFDIRTARDWGAKVFAFHAINKNWSAYGQPSQAKNSP